jgi:hypothetical protein
MSENAHECGLVEHFEQIETSGASYFICGITFGDITLAEGTRTVELLGREVRGPP